METNFLASSGIIAQILTNKIPMETSILIAKLISVIYLFAGLGFLVNPDFYQKTIKEAVKSSTFLMMGGAMATLVGILMITYHNIWSGEWWVVLITIIGWLSLLKGFLYLVFPQSLSAFIPMYKKQHMPIWGILMLVIGAIFGYYGFVA